MTTTTHTKRKTTATSQLRAALQAGEALTAMDAYRRWGVQHLAGTIGHLKRQGMAINSERIDVMNRDGNVCHVARYSLADDGQGSAPATTCGD